MCAGESKLCSYAAMEFIRTTPYPFDFHLHGLNDDAGQYDNDKISESLLYLFIKEEKQSKMTPP